MLEDNGCRNNRRQLFNGTLMESMGYTFRDPALLTQALTHPSMGKEHNQRLEFLGDAVLEFCASHALYALKPALPEGDMTRLRAAMVKEAALVAAARKISLADHIIMTDECARNGGRTRPSIISAAMEAVLAAIWLDGGLDAVRIFFERLWLPIDLTALRPVDDKSALQEWLQAQGRDVPVYHVVGEDGPPHERVFQVQVLVDNRVLAHAQGRSKKAAEQQAARDALAQLREGTHEA